MQKFILYIFTGILIIASCTGKNRDKEPEAKPDKLTDIHARDSFVNYLLQTLNQVEKNLNSISKKQGLVSFKVRNEIPVELQADIRTRLNSEIDSINSMMEKNKVLTERLNILLKNSSLKINELQNLVNNLFVKIAEKNRELSSLNTKLSELNSRLARLQTTVDTLKEVNETQALQLDEQSAALHRAYYIVGDKKDLIELQIIDRAGNLLQPGNTRLSSEPDPENFTMIDYTQVKRIPVYSKKVTIVTRHPKNSYKLDKDNQGYSYLWITDPVKFWGTNKFLVVINS